jgi:hypothetical protein
MIKAIKLFGMTQILILLISSFLIVNADETGDIILEKPELTIGQYWNYNIDVDEKLNYANAFFNVSGTKMISHNEIDYECYILNMALKKEDNINYGTWYIDIDTNNLILYEYNTSIEYYKIYLHSLNNVIPGIPFYINSQLFLQIFTPTDCYIKYPLKQDARYEYKISLSMYKNLSNRLFFVNKTFNISIKHENTFMNISNLGLLNGIFINQRLTTSERNITTDYTSSYFMTEETGYMPAQFVVADYQVKLTAELIDYGLINDTDGSDNGVSVLDINTILLIMIGLAVIVIIVVYIFKFKKIKK